MTRIDMVDIERIKKDSSERDVLIAILEELIAIEQKLNDIEENTEK